MNFCRYFLEIPSHKTFLAFSDFDSLSAYAEAKAEEIIGVGSARQIIKCYKLDSNSKKIDLMILTVETQPLFGNGKTLIIWDN